MNSMVSFPARWRRREVSGCLLQIQICDTEKPPCPPETRKSLAEQACPLANNSTDVLPDEINQPAPKEPTK